MLKDIIEVNFGYFICIVDVILCDKMVVNGYILLVLDVVMLRVGLEKVYLYF